MHILEARFVTSAVEPAGYPPAELPEVCFAGRSNVGKSSLMNTLVNRKKLVQVSGKPGKTRLLNFFEARGAQGAYSLVDLPGYGYARVSKVERSGFRGMVEQYLQARDTLRACVVLVDLRRGPEAEEREFFAYLRETSVRPIVVLTKADKVPKTSRMAQLQSAADRFGVPPKALTPFSAKTREGRDAVWRRIRAACR